MNYVHDAVIAVGRAFDKSLYDSSSSAQSNSLENNILINSTNIIQALNDTDFIGLTVRIQFVENERKSKIKAIIVIFSFYFVYLT